MTGRRVTLLFLSLLLTLGAGQILLRSAPSGDEVLPGPASSGSRTVTDPRLAQDSSLAGWMERWQIPNASLAPRPRVMDGTDVDGRLALYADGRFRPTPDALRLFQYFFLASGIEPFEVIRGRIVLEILARLEPPAAREAIEFLDRWITLQRRLESASESGELPADPQARFDSIRILRQQVLGGDLAEALFRDEDILTQLEIDLRTVQLDSTLSFEEKERRSVELEARLPQTLYAIRREATAPQRVRRQVDAMRAGGASEDEIFALREREFGHEAAERLAALDVRRRDFNARYELYLEQRVALLGGSPSASPALAAELEALRRSSFSDDELARVRAFDAADELDQPVDSGTAPDLGS